MAKPKHNYDGEDFYIDIGTFALQGMNDAEIADALDLDPEAFSTMKNGKYIGWDDEQNERRSNRILKVLARSRRKTTALVRGAYLKAALGGKKVKNIAKTKRPLFNDDGTPMVKVVNGKEEQEYQVLQVSETEFEQPPNIQALSTWLYHHDPDWRRRQRGEPDPEEVGNAEQGLNIEAWIAKENEIIDNTTEADIVGG